MRALSDVDFYDGSVGGVVLLSFPQPPQSLARPRWRESRAPPTPRVTLWPPTIPDDATPGWAEGVPSASAAARTSQAVRERRLEIEVQRFQARLERRQREQRERFFETVGACTRPVGRIEATRLLRGGHDKGRTAPGRSRRRSRSDNSKTSAAVPNYRRPTRSTSAEAVKWRLPKKRFHSSRFLILRSPGTSKSTRPDFWVPALSLDRCGTRISSPLHLLPGIPSQWFPSNLDDSSLAWEPPPRADEPCADEALADEPKSPEDLPRQAEETLPRGEEDDAETARLRRLYDDHMSRLADFYTCDIGNLGSQLFPSPISSGSRSSAK